MKKETNFKGKKKLILVENDDDEKQVTIFNF